jgi:hypothetical protein
MQTPCASQSVVSPPKLDSASPSAIISAPPITTGRMPTRSPARPMMTPPNAEPGRASANASAGAECALPRSAAIGFSAATAM